MKKIILLAVFITLSGLVLVPVLSQAAGLGSALGEFKEVAGAGGAGAQTYGDVQDVVGAGIGAALVLVGMIFMALMVYAGYLWMTARGEEEPIKKAQNIITAALIGFFIVASAYAITTFVSGRLGGGGKTSGGGPETPPSNPINTTEGCVAVGGMCISDLYDGGYEGDYDKLKPCDPDGDDPFVFNDYDGVGVCEVAFDKDTKNACCLCSKPDCAL